MNNCTKNKLVNWLSITNNDQTLYNFIDTLIYDIYRDLERNNLKIGIPYYKFKQKFIVYLFQNSFA